MKKIIALAVIISAIAAWKVYSATTQAQNIGIVSAVIENKTIAQMNLYAPKSKGQLIYCSDCLQSGVCVASGTLAGAWVVATATSNAVLGGLLGHCN